MQRYKQNRRLHNIICLIMVFLNKNIAQIELLCVLLQIEKDYENRKYSFESFDTRPAAPFADNPVGFAGVFGKTLACAAAV